MDTSKVPLGEPSGPFLNYCDSGEIAAFALRAKFNQGALGLASRALVALAAGGDPSRITRVAVRFSRYAYPGDDIDVSVYDAGPTADGQHAYAFEAASLGNTVLKNGWSR